MRSWIPLVPFCAVTLLTNACSSDPAPPLSVVAPPDAGQGHVVTEEEQSHFDEAVAFVEKSLDSKKGPGAALAVVIDGKLAIAKGIGSKNSAGDDPVNAETLFRVGSMSKMVTAAAVMSLVEEGKIDLAKPVTTYATELALLPPADPSAITVEELLTHTSGLADSYEKNCARGDDGITKWIAKEPLAVLVDPGILWNYSNTGYVVASRIAEVTAGVPFRELMKERVFGPAGMTTATLDVPEVADADIALGHTGRVDPPTEIAANSYDCAQIWGPGGTIASVVDYAHFVETLYAGGGAMLRPESVASMMGAHVPTHQGARLDYGYGLFVERDYKGKLVIHHEGFVDGFRSAMWMVPDEKFAVIAFVNGELVAPEPFVEKATNVFLHLPGKAPDDTTPPSTWGDYVGSYRDDTVLGSLEVTLVGTNLRLNAPALGFHGALVQIAGDTFVANDPTLSSLSFTFFADGSGPAKYVVTRAAVAKRE